MQFCSFNYILAFTAFFWLYWLLGKNKSSQNLLLLIANYIFYSLWDIKCSLLLLITSLSVYFGGLVIEKFKDDSTRVLGKQKSYWTLTGVVVFNLAILGIFKYFNFFIQSLFDLIGHSYSTLNIILPVGISFFTFSSISYIVDVYKGKIKPTNDVIACLAYISFFPAILSGPIHKATEQLPQYLKKREFNQNLIFFGFKSFLWGSFMKLCVADRLGMYVDAVYGNVPQHNGTTLALASVCYSIQIYADFAGYSLMAIGCGKMLGINLQENFVRPYFSKTITEFWSRWHMSLTGWFKNYLYIPLGGNRVSKPRWIINIMVVFLLSGLWHGAAYSFIIWGAVHGVAQIIEKLTYGDRLKTISDRISIPNILRMAFTFCIVSFAWIFFRIPTASESFDIIGKIFTSHGSPFIDLHTLFFAGISLPIMMMKDVCNHLFPNASSVQNRAISFVSSLLLVLFIMLFGKLDSQSFIYFQF